MQNSRRLSAARRQWLQQLFQQKRTWLLLIGAGAVVLLAVTLLLLLPAQAPDTTVSGEARAVSITDCVVYDGIWNAKRFSDEFYYPVGIAVADGKLIVADTMCDRVQIIEDTSNKRVGRPGQYGYAYIDSGALIDGYRENARFMKPAGVAAAPTGELYVCDTGNHVIRKIDDTYVITLAGDGSAGYAEGKEGAARFNAPRAAIMGEDGYLYIADTLNHCIRRMDAEGNVTLYAGGPTEAGYADGPLLSARFSEPSGLCFTKEGALLVADAANHAVRSIANGEVSTMAGAPAETPTSGYADGDTASARFYYPRDVAMLSDGSVTVADSMNHAIRLITAEGVRTLAGNGVAGKYYGSVENLKLSRPEGICTDGENLYIADTLNNRVLSIPLTPRFLAGRPSQETMLAATGLSTTSKYAYKGDIRVYLGSEKIDMGRVPPWNTGEHIFVPIRPLLEALGAAVTLNDITHALTITIAGQDTVLTLDKDYFIRKGIAVTTLDEIIRLFPYTLEWFDEFSLISLYSPSDLSLPQEEQP